MRSYPRRTLAALTAGLLAVLAYVLLAGPPTLYDGPVWALAFAVPAWGLALLAWRPDVPVELRATVAALGGVAMFARAAAFGWTAYADPITGLNLGVGAITWLVVAGHTSALLIWWPALGAERD